MKKRKPKDSVPENLPEQKGDARDLAGAAANVSGRSVDHASKVVNQGSAELVKAVERGEVSVSTAAKLAELPKAEQSKAVKGGRDAIKESVTPPLKRPTYPLSDAVVKLFGNLVGTLNMIRLDHGTASAMFESPKWDKSETEYVVHQIRALNDAFTELTKEVKSYGPKL